MNRMFTATLGKYFKADLRRMLAVTLSLLIMPGAFHVNAFGASGAGLIPQFRVQLLDPSFDPSAPVGGVPFCSSGSLGTILCYPPSFLKAAYNFLLTTGKGGLDGSGQTIVIVDAFGSPPYEVT